MQEENKAHRRIIKMEITSERICNMTKQSDSEIKEFIKNAKAGCVCYGDGLMLHGALAELQEDGFNVRYIIDDTPEKQGRIVDGIEIVSSSDKRICSEKYIIGTNTAIKRMRKRLESWRRDSVIFLPFGKYSIWKHYDECVYVRDNLLEDEKSVEIYNLAMYAQLTDYYDLDFTGYGEPDQYFAIPEFDLLQGEHFVDVGAFVGDILDEFIRHSRAFSFNKYICFEPDEKNVKAIETRKKRLCAEWNLSNDAIEIVKAGVGEHNTKAKLSSEYSGMANRVVLDELKGGVGVDIVKLDDYLAGQKVTFIKADIEGMEEQALKGARELIKNQKPKLAICVYHLPWDIYKIPMLVKEMNSEYRFKMRLHSRGYGESVLYCY